MTDPAGLVELDRMTFRYGDLVAARDVSFRVERGEMFGLIGPDGAGKTTTLRVVLGLLSVAGGTVRTCGLDPRRQRRAMSARVGYLAQRFSFYGDLSVDENVAFFARVHGVRRWRPRRDELLELLRMSPFRRRQAERLSGGMKQKLALACTLIHTPELLVMDEPTTGVDPVSRRDFWRILARLRRDGMTILLTTPYLDEAERCSRVALMSAGRILTIDAPERLRRAETRGMVELLAEPRRLAAEILRAREDVREVETFGQRLHVSLCDVPAAEASAAAERLAAALREAHVNVEVARVLLPSLEDVFIDRIREVEASSTARSEEAS
jgi:ABC-2 type transport system ATP-binding protein